MCRVNDCCAHTCFNNEQYFLQSVGETASLDWGRGAENTPILALPDINRTFLFPCKYVYEIIDD